MSKNVIEEILERGDSEALSELEKSVESVLEQEREFNPAAFYEPNKEVEKFTQAVGEGSHKVFILSAANGVGKSAAAVCVLRSIIWGPANEWFNGKMYKKWPYPKKFWYITEQTNLKDNIVGQSAGANVLFNQWLPKGRFTLMKGDYSYYSHFQSDNGWTGSFKTFDMSREKFESTTLGVVILDEPPPEPVFDACIARLRQGGILIIVMTPLSDSAWVFDRLVEKMDELAGRVFLVYADIEAACKQHGVRGHLEHEDIQVMMSLWKTEEIEARAHGKPTHLRGRVYKALHKELHVQRELDPHAFKQKEFRIFNVVDPHDARPPFVTWFAVDKLLNIRAIAEFPSELEYRAFEDIGSSWALTTKDVVERMKMFEASCGWHPEKIVRIMDPNFGAQKHSETGKKVSQIWREHGKALHWPMRFRTNVVDKLEPGHELVREWIKPNKDGHVRFKIGDNCFDEHTEVLTENGWTRFADLAQGVKVATLNLTTQHLEFQEPTRYIRRHYVGEMIQSRGKTLDFCVTPDHRMLAYKKGGRKLRIVRASLLKGVYTIPSASNGLDDTHIGRIELWSGKQVSAEDWAEFMGWYLSEGSATGVNGGKTKRVRVTISQSQQAHPEKCLLIEGLLRRLGFHFYYGSGSYVIESKAEQPHLWTLLHPMGNASDKHIPRGIMRLPRHCLEKLLLAMLLGDGNSLNGLWRYSTTSQRLANDLTELLARLGKSSRVHARQPIKGKTCYSVTILLNTNQLVNSKYKKDGLDVTRTAYDGEVFCVTVPNGTLLVRRHGYQMFCGNCTNLWRHMTRYAYAPREGKTAERHGPGEKVAEKYKDGCFDHETEILTERGWKYFRDLSRTECVATLNLRTRHVEFQLPSAWQAYPYTGRMIRCDTPTLDLCVTPDHRMLVFPQSYKLRFRHAEDLLRQDTIPIASRGVCHDGPTHVELWPGHSVSSEDWAEFIGWYVAEGSATGTRGGKIQVPGRGYSVFLSQSQEANPEKCDRIAALLNRLAFHWNYKGNRVFSISNKALWEILFPLGHSEEKFIPRHILSMPHPALTRLWEAMLLGDGSRGCYTTTSQRLAEDATELLARIGKACSFSTRMPKHGVINGRTVRAKHLQYIIAERQDSVASITNGKKEYLCHEQEYNAMVYCVTVPNSTLLVRRNHKTMFCGNCDTVRYLMMYLKGPKDEPPPADKLPEHYEMYGANTSDDVRVVNSLDPFSA